MSIQARKGLEEYFSHGFFILLAFGVYTYLPYFQRLLQPGAKSLLFWYVGGYFAVGLPYFLLRNYFFWDIYSKKTNKSTLVILYLLHAGSSLKKIFFSRPKERRFMDFHIDEATRVAILAVVLKFFYVPLMVSFLVGNYEAFIGLWNSPPVGMPLVALITNWAYFVLYNFIFLIDTGIYTFGYLFEAKWLGNEIKSVDPYLSGWVFALICYPPFNGVVDMSVPTYQSTLTIFSIPLLLIVRIVIIAFYLIYVWASIALFTKASNLTNRGIVGHGPYAFIRHPAYASKNIAWWLERLPYLTSWLGIVSLVAWNVIYIMRALTEERHLLADTNYKEYVEKVKYRFIPGVI